MLVKGYVKFSSCRALHPALSDVLRHSTHRMPGIIAGAKRSTRRPQTLANRVLPPPDSFRQSLIDDDHLALGRIVGSLEATAGDDRDAHCPEIVAHDELVVVDVFKGLSIVGAVVLDRSSDRIGSSIRRQTRHGSRSQYARYGVKPVEDPLICLRGCWGFRIPPWQCHRGPHDPS